MTKRRTRTAPPIASLGEDSFDLVFDERDEVAFSITFLLHWLKHHPQVLSELMNDFFEIKEHLPSTVKDFLYARHRQLFGPLTGVSRIDDDPVKKITRYPLSIPARVSSLIHSELN